ncbi:MAG: SMP-30/gluconolactonase/LRE family protein, partial [Gammaproteobacteria bacterium]|nr:SMP-30/gluconolactonase/LRE family protein [Gammaproteobacteria bacterium]
MLKVELDGLSFPEGPRWHQGRLYFSDFYQHGVFALDTEGQVQRVVTVDHQPSGLGWMPDGRMLIVSMLDRRLLCFDGKVLREHADLSALAAWHCNDMVVDGVGRAYVGNFGFDTHGDAEP